MLAALILAPAFAAAADNLAGQASVIDGDTLEIHGTRIRLWGIDAPESSQLCRGEDSLQYRCGAKAANDLDAFIASRTVNCLPRLCLDGLPPHNPEHFDVNAPKRRLPQSKIVPPKPPLAPDR